MPATAANGISVDGTDGLERAPEASRPFLRLDAAVVRSNCCSMPSRWASDHRVAFADGADVQPVPPPSG